MSCRAMVTSPPSSENEHRSATTLRVNSTLPAPMIAIRIMSESVPLSALNEQGRALPERERVRRSDGCDAYACLGKLRQDPGIRGTVGDQLADRSDLADPSEGHEPDLGAVSDYDSRAGALEQRPVRMGLNLVMRRQAGFEGDPIRAHEHDVEVEPCQARLGNGSDQLVRLGPGHSARHHELQTWAHRHLGRDVQCVRDEREALMVDQGPRHFRRGRSAGQADRVTWGDSRRGRAGNPELLVPVPTALVAKRELIEDSLRDRAPVSSRQQALALEKIEVTTDCGGRDAKLVGDVGDVYA